MSLDLDSPLSVLVHGVPSRGVSPSAIVSIRTDVRVAPTSALLAMARL